MESYNSELGDRMIEDLTVKLLDTADKIVSSYSTVGFSKGEWHCLQLVERMYKLLLDYPGPSFEVEIGRGVLLIHYYAQELEVKVIREARGDARETLARLSGLCRSLLETYNDRSEDACSEND